MHVVYYIMYCLLLIIINVYTIIVRGFDVFIYRYFWPIRVHIFVVSDNTRPDSRTTNKPQPITEL